MRILNKRIKGLVAIFLTICFLFQLDINDVCAAYYCEISSVNEANENLLGSSISDIGDGITSQTGGGFIYEAPSGATFSVGGTRADGVYSSVNLTDKGGHYGSLRIASITELSDTYVDDGNSYPVKKVVLEWADEVEVNFDSHGGTYGEAYIAPNTFYTFPGDSVIVERYRPSKPGYDFAGWSIDGNASVGDEGVEMNTIIIPEVLPSGNTVTLHAIYTPHTYVVYYHNEAGVIIDAYNYIYDSAGIALKGATDLNYIVERIGWHAKKWLILGASGEPIMAGNYDMGAVIPIDEVEAEHQRAGLLAYIYPDEWEPNTFTIKFDPNGGTGAIAPHVHTADSNTDSEDVSQVTSGVSRLGYTLAGWSLTPDGQAVSDIVFDFTNIENEQTVYAIWEPIPYTVRYNANGGNGAMADQTGVVSGVATILYANQFTNVEYIFAGWATSASGPVEYADQGTISHLASEIGQVIELFAVWKEIEKPPVEEPIEPVPGPTPSDPMMVGIGTVHLAAGQAYYLGGDSAYKINGGSTRYPYGTIFYVPSSGNYTISAY